MMMPTLSTPVASTEAAFLGDQTDEALPVVTTHENGIISTIRSQESESSQGSNRQILEALTDVAVAMEELNGPNSKKKEKQQQQQQPKDKKSCSVVRYLIKYLTSHDGKELIVCGGIGVSLLGLGYILEDVNPEPRPIPFQYLQDTGAYVLNLSFNELSNGDTVPDWIIAVLAVVICPLVQMMLGFLVGRRRNNNALGDVHRTMCVYLLALSVNDFLTWVLKSYMGYLRPNFYQVCQPNETHEYCTNDSEGAAEFEYGGSFPSGHASFTFCSITLFYLYLERTFGVSSVEQAFVTTSSMEEEQTEQTGTTGTVASSNGTYSTSSNNNHREEIATTKRRLALGYSRPPMIYRLVSILCALPLVAGCFLSASRVVDNRHHPADIIAGILMGVFIAVFFHNIWFQDPRFERVGRTQIG